MSNIEELALIYEGKHPTIRRPSDALAARQVRRQLEEAVEAIVRGPSADAAAILQKAVDGVLAKDRR